MLAAEVVVVVSLSVSPSITSFIVFVSLVIETPSILNDASFAEAVSVLVLTNASFALPLPPP